MTEQGETTAQKYPNNLNAAYNLALLMAGVADASLWHTYSPKQSHPLEPVMDRLTEKSRQAYEDLLRTDGVILFSARPRPSTLSPGY